MRAFLLFIIAGILVFGSCEVYALEYGSVSNNGVYIDYANIDIAKTLKNADYYFDIANKAQDDIKKSEYFKKAQYEYNIIALAKHDEIHSLIRLGRIYDYQNKDKYAKAYFSRAIGINNKNSDAYYYFGNFYNTRKDYKKALKCYRKALELGRREDFESLNKMGKIFEKFGDLKRANICYKKAFLAKPEDELIPDKIRSIEELNYNPAGYYDRRNSK